MLNYIEILGNNSHWYPRGKSWYPSITTILSCYPKGEGFSRWLANAGSYENAEGIRDNAAKRGTRVHDTVEAMLRDPSLLLAYEDFTLEEWGMIEGFCNWYTDHKPVVDTEFIEKVLYSDTFKVAGKADLRCSVGGEDMVVDFKTSSAIHRSMNIQANMYALMYTEMGMPTETFAILRLGTRHKRKYEFAVQGKNDQFLAGFLACQSLWEQENNSIEPPFIKVPSTLSLNLL